MNPGLVVKLRPSGPWRIGPDSGARNRVDVIYHSDSLYSAVTAAMARLGWLEEWLDATARTGSPAVSFSSCFPYLDDLVFIVPPRTVWPPASTSTKAARVRWKSARFVPLSVVQSILAGERLDENQWSVDGPSDCLVPTGKHGPFRTAVRFSAGVDRLTGTSERHSTACIEFRAGSGLWTIVSFTDEAAQEQWSAKVKAAFRLLADTGFGGERSRGWGRSDAPEFIDGTLPDLILPLRPKSAAAEEPEEPAEGAEVSVIAAADIAPLELEPAPLPSRDREGAVPEPEAPAVENAPTTEPDESALVPSRDRTRALASEGAVPEPEAPTVDTAPAPVVPAVEAAFAEAPAAAPEVPVAETPAATEAASSAIETAPAAAPATEPDAAVAETAQATELANPADDAASAAKPEASVVEAMPAELPATEPEAPAAASEPSVAEAASAAEPEASVVGAMPAEAPAAASEPPVTEAAPTPDPEVHAVEAAPAEPPAAAPEPPAVEAAPEPEPEAPAAEPAPPIVAAAPTHPHWLLSLFTPAPADSVDWRRGNYTVLPRGGRVDSPAGSGELKKQIQMVAEGSVLYAESAPRGSAADVAPDGFAHPVFRAGFAVAIPLPEVR